MSTLSTIIMIMLWIVLIVYATIAFGYDPYDWKKTEYMTDEFYFKVFVGLYSFAILLNIAFPSPVTLNSILQAFSPVISNIAWLFAVFYMISKTLYDPYGWRKNSEWLTTDVFWRYFIIAQVVSIFLSITWPSSFSVSATVWYQLVIPILNQLVVLLGLVLILVYAWDPYNWKESPWFSNGIMTWTFFILYVISVILNSFPTAITNGLLFPTEIVKLQNTSGVTLAQLMYVTTDVSGNQLVYSANGNGLTIGNNDSIYLVPKRNGMLIGVGADGQVYGMATLDYNGSISLVPVGSAATPFRMYVTGNSASPVYQQLTNTNQPAAQYIIPTINAPFNYVQLVTNVPMPTHMIIANCNPCTNGPSTITLTTATTSKTFQLDTYQNHAIQTVVFSINTVPPTIMDTTTTPFTPYTSATVLTLGTVALHEYVACYAKHADGTQSCSIIYNSGAIKVYDLMNSAGSIRFFALASVTRPLPTPTPAP